MDQPWGHNFYISLYRENMKKSSCLKPQRIEPWYLVCSIYLWTSTKFVQIMPPGPKIARAGGHMINIGIYRENMKKSSWLKPQGLEPL